jgi:hypothetical protein
MWRNWFLTLLAVNIVSHSTASEEWVRLHSDRYRSGVTFEWWLSESRAKDLPKWNHEANQDRPLSLLKAIEIARKSAGAFNKLDSVSIDSIRGADDYPPLSEVFYYRVVFRGPPYDHRTCIVLMDGTLVRPTRANRENKP